MANTGYGRELITSALGALVSALNTPLPGDPKKAREASAVPSSWTGALIGSCVGALGSYLGSRKKSSSGTLLTGLVGGTVGLGAGLVWSKRERIARGVSTAIENTGAVRDAHWLVKHPICYG